MLKNEALEYFKSKTKLAAAAGVKPSSVSVWGELVPEKRAMRLQIASDGVLRYDPSLYDQHKENKQGCLKNENQQPDR